METLKQIQEQALKDLCNGDLSIHSIKHYIQEAYNLGRDNLIKLIDLEEECNTNKQS